MKSGLVNYEMIADGIDDEEILACVNVQKYVDVCKSLTKKDSLTLSADIYHDGSVSSLNCQRHDNNMDKLTCEGDDQQEIVADMLETYYSGEEPTAKIPVSKFTSAMAGFKIRKCSTVIFSLQLDCIVMKGYKDGIPISATKFTLDGKKVVEYNDGQLPESRRVIPNGIKPGITIQDYSIGINYSTCGTWITKIPRLSYPSSIISIYFKQDAPLIIVSHIGTMGFASFTFVDSKD